MQALPLHLVASPLGQVFLQLRDCEIVCGALPLAKKRRRT